MGMGVGMGVLAGKQQSAPSNKGQVHRHCVRLSAVRPPPLRN